MSLWFLLLAAPALGSDGASQEVLPAPAVPAHAGEVVRCYEQRLRRDPALAGRIEVVWRLAQGEVVGKPTARSNSTGDERLARCVLRRARRWSFPSEVEGEFSMPFLFRPVTASASPGGA